MGEGGTTSGPGCRPLPGTASDSAPGPTPVRSAARRLLAQRVVLLHGPLDELRSPAWRRS